MSAELDQPEPSIPIAATANETEPSSGAIKSIELREVTYAFPSIEGIRVDGMVGFELFRRFAVRLDYGARTMTITSAMVNRVWAAITEP